MTVIAVIFFELLCFIHYVSCHILQMVTIQCELGKRLVIVTFIHAILPLCYCLLC